MRSERFILTKELGKLAKWLRILGYDSVYYRGDDIAGLVIQALREKRILLTRSPSLTKYKGIQAVIVKHDKAEDQIEQVTTELELPLSEEETFHICVECNAPLENVDKKEIKDIVPEYVFQTQKEFKRCPECDKIFWKGTHWDLVSDWLGKKGIKRQGPKKDRIADDKKAGEKESNKSGNNLE